MSWYVMYGDPRWDADELWTTMGHLYKGGMWFKKKSVLQGEGHYNTEKSADGSTDLRTTQKEYLNTNSSIYNSGLPDAADAGKYFYLPAIGYYITGQLTNIGGVGAYWTSNANPWLSDRAYDMDFSRVNVSLNKGYSCAYGFRVGGFE